MEKAYRKITWHNGGQPPISAENLQAISDGLNLVDDRVIELDKDKLEARTESPELGDVIKWDGSRWVNGPAPGGGGEGTSDYQDLSHKPSINGVTLAGDVSGEDLGFVDSSVTDEIKSYITADDGLVFRFVKNGEGKRGYLEADGSFRPFNEGGAGGDAVVIPFIHPNASSGTTVKTISAYTNETGADQTLYLNGFGNGAGGAATGMLDVKYDSTNLARMTANPTSWENLAVILPAGKTLVISYMDKFAGSVIITDEPIGLGERYEEHVPFSGSIIDCVLPVTDSGTQIVATGGTVCLNRYPLDLSDKTKLTVAAKRHTSSSSGTFYIAVYDSKSNPTAAQIRTKAQEDGTYHTLANSTTCTKYEFDISNMPKTAYVYCTHNTAGSYTLMYVGEVSFS